jgi:predicted nucleic acid-binding protein
MTGSWRARISSDRLRLLGLLTNFKGRSRSVAAAGSFQRLDPGVLALKATMAGWAERAAARGQRFGVGDLLVAAIAAEHGAAVWSLDADFARLKRLGFVALHTP